MCILLIGITVCDILLILYVFIGQHIKQQHLTQWKENTGCFSFKLFQFYFNSSCFKLFPVYMYSNDIINTSSICSDAGEMYVI